jgi:aspartate/methionine/tyrosine aminotransferase
MTGWRLGWTVLPPELVEPVERLAMSYYICPSAPTQHAALACFIPKSLLCVWGAIAEERRAELPARRQLLLDGLSRIGLPVPVPPDRAFYVYFDVSGTGLTAWNFCQRLLSEAHVALTPGRDFSVGTGLSNSTADTHVRFSYAASREALHEGLDRLGAFTARLGNSAMA